MRINSLAALTAWRRSSRTARLVAMAGQTTPAHVRNRFCQDTRPLAATHRLIRFTESTRQPSIKLVSTTIFILSVTCALLSSCALPLQTPDNTSTPDSNPITMLIFYSRAVLRATPSERLAMLANAKSAYARHKTAVTSARLGLTYGQPGYKGYAPENGSRYVHKALTLDPTYWGAAATAYLQQFAALCEDNANVRQQLEDKKTKLDVLDRQLTNAQQKLHALTRIETRLGP